MVGLHTTTIRDGNTGAYDRSTKLLSQKQQILVGLQHKTRCCIAKSETRTAVISGQAIHLPLTMTPISRVVQARSSTLLALDCPKNGDVPKSPLLLLGSTGAIGRHNKISYCLHLTRVPSEPAFTKVCALISEGTHDQLCSHLFHRGRYAGYHT
jgi:hypothetical protein